MQSHSQKTSLGGVFRSAGMLVSGCALIGMMMVIVVDVGLRHTLNMPLPGVYDLVSILLLIMVFSGMAQVVISGSEIVIDLLDPVFPAWVARGLRVLAAGSTLGVGIYLLIAMIEPARSAHRYGDRSLELGVPVWVLWIFAFFGIAGLACAGAVRLVAELRGDKGGDLDADEQDRNLI